MYTRTLQGVPNGSLMKPIGSVVQPGHPDRRVLGSWALNKHTSCFCALTDQSERWFGDRRSETSCVGKSWRAAQQERLAFKQTTNLTKQERTRFPYLGGFTNSNNM